MTEPVKAGDTFTMEVPRTDLWARILRLFGINRTKIGVFRVSATATADAG